MTRTIIGLEITEESVRAVEVRTGRTPVLLAAGSVPLPPDAAHDSEVLDADAVTLAVRQLWARAGFKSRSVILGLGSRRILVREYTTQAMHPRLLRQALPFQVQDLLPVPIDQAVLDFYPASQTGDQVTGLLVAAVAETVELLVSTLTNAKLEVERVDLMPFGLARIAAVRAAPGETVAMVHIADHTTYVVVARDGIPLFVRIIPIDVPTTSARARAEAQQQDADDEAEVEVFSPPTLADVTPLRSRASLRTDGAIAEATDPAVLDLVRRVRSTVQFYDSRPGSTPVTSTHLSGAGAAIAGVHSALVQVLVTRVEVVELADISAMKGPLDPELALDLVGTLGVVFGEGI
jgi:type IV pilus assembly protein PilM